MMHAIRITTELPKVAAGLGPAAQRTANFILANIRNVADLSITDIARAAEVSEPTVARLCQSLGFAGFKDFRLHLAREIAGGGGMPFVHADVTPRDRPQDIAEKVIDRSIEALIRLKSQLDQDALIGAIRLLSEARRIEFYGQGNSGIVALDAQHKFFRIGIPAIAYTDPHTHMMSAAILGPRDAVICFSRAGETSDLKPTLAALKENHVPVVGIMPKDSTLAAYCTEVLHVDHADDPNVYAPTSSRMAQLAMVDILAVSVATRLGPGAATYMESAKRAVLSRRIASENG